MKKDEERIVLDFSKLNLPKFILRIVRFLSAWFQLADSMWQASKHRYVTTFTCNFPDYQTMIDGNQAARVAMDKVIKNWEKKQK